MNFKLLSVRVCICVAALWTILLSPQLGSQLHSSESTYANLYQQLSQFDNRLAGSDNFIRSQEYIINAYKKMGLTVERQYYNTVVPKTLHCSLTVNGVSINGLFPFAPNHVAPSTLGAESIQALLVDLGKGQVEDFNNVQIKDSIVLLDMDCDPAAMAMAFSEGAHLVIFIGTATSRQWDVLNWSSESPFGIPRIYISAADAQRQGLRTLSGTNATCRLSSVWEQKQTSNLWVKIPANAAEKDAAREAVIITGILDTFGIIPDMCPQKRDCANIALMTETVAHLLTQQRKRDLYCVIYGSHYSAQEGARFFYHAAQHGKNPAYFTQRQTSLQEDLAINETLLAFLSDTETREDTQHPLFSVGKRAIIKLITTRRNDLNFRIRHAAINHRQEEAEALRAEKKNWSFLRGEIEELHHDSGTASNRPLPQHQDIYNDVLADAQNNIASIIQEMHTDIACEKSHETLARSISDTIIVSQFSYDFANSTAPWICNYNGDYSGSLAPDRLGSNFFSGYIDTLNAIHNSCFPDSCDAPLYVYQYGSIRSDTLIYPAARSLSCFPAIASQHFACNFNSMQDALNYDQMPDTRDSNLAGLIPQMNTYFSALLNDTRLSSVYPGRPTKFQDTVLYQKNEKVVKAVNFAKGSSDVEGPSVHSMIIADPQEVSTGLIPGHNRNGLGFSNGNGYITIPRLAMQHSYFNKTYAIGFDENGQINRFSARIDSDLVHVPLTYCYGGGFFIPTMALSYERFSNDTAFKAKTNTKLDARHSVMYGGAYSSAFYTNKKMKGKIINNGGVCIINATPEEAVGIGIKLSSDSLINTNVIRQSAHNFNILNESRLQALREKNIVLEDIEALHTNAADYLNQANTLRENNKIGSAQSQELFANTLEAHAYQPILQSSNDMVKAVVILLILCIPFAFALERLLFGFTSIYKQIFGFLGIFLTTFGLLFYAHPAFSFASSPSIIFLAFVIIMMSGLVIFIVMSKFKSEILALQGLGGNSHGGNAGASTALASIVIGISGMRNRPLKTFLISLTIVLLTFTILVFASFGSQIGVTETYIGQNAEDARIEVRRSIFLKLPRHVTRSIKDIYTDSYHVFQRGAYFRYPGEPTGAPKEGTLYAPKSQLSLSTKSAIAFDFNEIAFNDSYKKLLSNDQYTQITHPIYLHETSSSILKLNIGDPITYQGNAFTYAGTFDSSVIQELKFLDGSGISCPDFEATMADDYGLRSSSGEGLNDKLQQLDLSKFRWMPPEEMVIISYADNQAINGFDYALMLYPKKGSEIYEDAYNIAEIFNGPIYAKSNEGVKRFFYTTRFASSGMSDVLIPLILGGLIIFSSLLGSIVDREREIFTFSALGLAPPNIAALFFAESSVYAVIGGLGGYIISQFVAIFLAYLSDIGVFQAPEMNFSSLSSTYTILLVMATVLLSTVIPALKAGKSANPGIARKWKMPAPVDNTLSFLFPFTASTSDLGGILTFLSEHFHSHSDASLGTFATSDVCVQAHGGGHYSLTSHISLAPFDLGIYQKFTMSSQESDIKGILEIRIKLERISGSSNSWIRSNRNFIDGLRGQFLLWRSLPPESISHYVQLSKETEVDAA